MAQRDDIVGTAITLAMAAGPFSLVAALMASEGGLPTSMVIAWAAAPFVGLCAFFALYKRLGERAARLEREQRAHAVDVAVAPEALPAPEAVPVVRTATQACPRCRRTLPAEDRGDERVCAQGCGALLTHSGVEHLLARADIPLDVARELAQEQGAEKAACPACGALMKETRLRGVLVDLCVACGALWLDESERARLAREHAFVAEEAAPAPAPAPARRS